MRVKNRVIICGILAVLLPLGARAESNKARLAELVAQIKTGDSFDLRKQIIETAALLSKKPERPDEVDELMGKAKAIMKNAQSPEDFKEAAEALDQASALAPWDGDLYYNCGVAREKANNAVKAVDDFNLYLLAKPHAKDRQSVRERIGALKYAAKRDDIEGAVFTYTMPESLNPNGTTLYKMTIHGGQVTETATYTHVTSQGAQNGALMGIPQPMGTGTLQGKLFKLPLGPDNFSYYLISPDGQTISSCDSNGNLTEVGNPNVPVYKRVP